MLVAAIKFTSVSGSYFSKGITLKYGYLLYRVHFDNHNNQNTYNTGTFKMFIQVVHALLTGSLPVSSIFH